MEALLAIAGYVALTFITFVFYLAVMQLKQRRYELPQITAKIGYCIYGIGWMLDVLFNLSSSVLFLDFPREILFTSRLQRLKRTTGWRSRLACWVCANLIEPFDPGHCK